MMHVGDNYESSYCEVMTDQNHTPRENNEKENPEPKVCINGKEYTIHRVSPEDWKELTSQIKIEKQPKSDNIPQSIIDNRLPKKKKKDDLCTVM